MPNRVIQLNHTYDSDDSSVDDGDHDDMFHRATDDGL